MSSTGTTDDDGGGVEATGMATNVAAVAEEAKSPPGAEEEPEGTEGVTVTVAAAVAVVMTEAFEAPGWAKASHSDTVMP